MNNGKSQINHCIQTICVDNSSKGKRITFYCKDKEYNFHITQSTQDIFRLLGVKEIPPRNIKGGKIYFATDNIKSKQLLNNLLNNKK